MAERQREQHVMRQKQMMGMMKQEEQKEPRQAELRAGLQQLVEVEEEEESEEEQVGVQEEGDPQKRKER